MVMGMAMKRTPHSIATAVISFPATVAGATSPYPTVVSVTTTNQQACHIL